MPRRNMKNVGRGMVKLDIRLEPWQREEVRKAAALADMTIKAFVTKTLLEGIRRNATEGNPPTNTKTYPQDAKDGAYSRTNCNTATHRDEAGEGGFGAGTGESRDD